MFGLQREPFTLQLFLFRSVFHLYSLFGTLSWLSIISENISLWQVRQGVTQTKQQTQPGKYANTELMKVGYY